MSAFVDALCAGLRASEWDHPIHTIYFGGGTPSRLPIPDLAQVFDALHDRFDLSVVDELTLEANPDDVSAAYLADLKSLGITRLSMGVQSFSEERLRFMNRAHNADEAKTCLKLLNEAGFETWTADLIYGNPGQSVDELRAELRTLLSFDPPHVSAYALTIEPRTRLGKQVALGKLMETDDGMVAEHMDVVAEMLAEAGLQRYEVCNFAKPGHEAVHNSRYWTHEPYLGFGPAAHSFDGARRWSNVRDLARYVASGGFVSREGLETLTSTQLAEERLLMGLRTREGVTRTELRERYRYELGAGQEGVVARLVQQGVLTDDGDGLCLTSAGYPLADAVTLRITAES